jgi:hypothetical protein
LELIKKEEKELREEKYKEYQEKKLRWHEEWMRDHRVQKLLNNGPQRNETALNILKSMKDNVFILSTGHLKAVNTV